jgi:hypothetical protein
MVLGRGNNNGYGVRSPQGIRPNPAFTSDYRKQQLGYSVAGGFMRTLLRILIVAVVLAVVAGLGWVLYSTGKSLLSSGTTSETAQQTPQQQEQTLMAEIAAVTVVPTDEKPVIYLINDITRSGISGEPFYARATNGDMVFEYKKASLIVLYNPTLKRVINIKQVPRTQP